MFYFLENLVCLLAREWKKTGGHVRNHYSGLCELLSSLCLQLPSSGMSSQRLFQWTLVLVEAVVLVKARTGLVAFAVNT